MVCNANITKGIIVPIIHCLSSKTLRKKSHFLLFYYSHNHSINDKWSLQNTLKQSWAIFSFTLYVLTVKKNWQAKQKFASIVETKIKYLFKWWFVWGFFDMQTSRQDRACLVPLPKIISGLSRQKYTFNSTTSFISVPTIFFRFELKKIVLFNTIDISRITNSNVKNKVLCVTCNSKNLKI